MSCKCHDCNLKGTDNCYLRDLVLKEKAKLKALVEIEGVADLSQALLEVG